MKQVVSVIIPAAGSGKRFRESVHGPQPPKLYSRLANKPLIVHTLGAFNHLPSVREIIVAVEPGSQARFRREILSRLKLTKPILLVTGGRTRAESVWRALKRVSKESVYVCIHDGARPLVQPEWLAHLMKNLNGWDGVVLGKSIVPTVKVFERKTGWIKRTLNRSELFEAETPQLIKKEILINSYRSLGQRAFQATDDASLVEAMGGRLKALPHSEPNIKVTTHQDLVLARNFRGENAVPRFGLGFDRHRLVPERPFYLGGVRVPAPFGPLGHSDGDALLHAITDAILGALGAGDIGDFFPNTSKSWKNVRSEKFIREVVKLAKERGLRPSQVDATVILERPKLGIYKKRVQVHIAKLLSLAPLDVSIKAKTGEGLGPEGQGEAISCQALVVLTPIAPTSILLRLRGRK
ncbi:MAG: 2-C-methyl-D-erythritol 4-phosphate cytidylyltransferase [Candidatus Omnitrophica bacterium]|nr:2-C-methyl-D-erythritol 4-phosphate cytidylyltransferase [Candidatus Omnitrophota bacterium]